MTPDSQAVGMRGGPAVGPGNKMSEKSPHEQQGEGVTALSREIMLKAGKAIFLIDSIHALVGSLYLTSRRILFMAETGTRCKAHPGREPRRRDGVLHFHAYHDDIHSISIQEHGLALNMTLTTQSRERYTFIPDYLRDWIDEFDRSCLPLKSLPTRLG